MTIINEAISPNGKYFIYKYIVNNSNYKYNTNE